MFKSKPTLRVLFQPYSHFYMNNIDPAPYLKINRLVPNTNVNVVTKHVCLLAGNIGKPFCDNYWDLISHCNKVFDLTIIILGTYELEESCIIDVIDHIEEKIKTYPNVLFLHNQSVILENNTRVIGAPLWPIHHKMSNVMGYTKSVAISQFNTSIEFVKKELKQCSKFEDVVLITSAPTSELDTECFNFNLNWVYGHSVKNGIQQYGSSQLIANQRCKSPFDPYLSFYLK